MGQKIIVQPNGRYAIWSTVVDAIILWDATEEHIRGYYMQEAVVEAERQTTARLQIAHGTHPYRNQPRFGPASWEEAVEDHNDRYPEETIPLSGDSSDA